ncbi:nucleoside ABC transporter membrane protein [Dongia mobilis]|uniref:Nucleoside ABC transporter membrane protein n=1 Tax=Dongia mobilis TaxID=578943 RepID=A0A4R6WR94_9PROT|nr:ABC transporter permease [Dongia mobilis]TDQ84016.1 nucleoside ABC transporter membrane protein [Dongia mobilis]
MESAVLVSILLSVIAASTPLLLAGIGELVVERSGVLNLGVEGMMLVGAIAGFAVTYSSGSASLGILAAALGGMAMALVFAFLTLTLQANQVATGLALTIFGIGLAAMMGAGFVGHPVPKLPGLDLPLLSAIPVIGPLVFGQDFLVYFSIAAVIGASWFLYRSHGGLVLRAIGDSHDAAHAIGYPVIRIRYLACLFGGAMSGLAGAYLSLSYTPMWAEDMSAGRGWIALALVVFATWRPGRLLLGAYLFGGITILQFHVQTMGLGIPPQFVSMLPYLATILVLCAISSDATRIRLNAPACLGRPFHAAG